MSSTEYSGACLLVADRGQSREFLTDLGFYSSVAAFVLICLICVLLWTLPDNMLLAPPGVGRAEFSPFMVASWVQVLPNHTFHIPCCLCPPLPRSLFQRERAPPPMAPLCISGRLLLAHQHLAHPITPRDSTDGPHQCCCLFMVAMFSILALFSIFLFFLLFSKQPSWPPGETVGGHLIS